MDNVGKKLKEIAKEWFFREPLFFSLYCMHTLVQNENMNIPIRTGQLRIEYNSKLLDGASNEILEEYFKIEMYRI